MNKTRIFYLILVIILVIYPVYVYADAYNKTVTNNITLDASVVTSDEESVDLPIYLNVTVSGSDENIEIEFITLRVYVFDNDTSGVVDITVTSSPTGSVYVEVDESGITTPEVYEWNFGDFHNITAIPIITIVADESRCVFHNWSDSGAISHIIEVEDIEVTYTAYFDLQYKLDVTGGSGTNWYVEDYNASSSAPYVKNLVSGESRDNLVSYTLNGATTGIDRDNTGNYTLYVVMDDYYELTWNYATQYYCEYSSYFTNLSVIQSGSQTSDSWYDNGEDATIETTTPQVYGDITFVFDRWVWSYGGVSQSDETDNPVVITMNSYVDIMAYWIGYGDGVDVEIYGNATITIDGVPIVTPDIIHFDDNTSHDIVAIYTSDFVDAILNVLGNATITYDGNLVITPNIFYLGTGSNHTIISLDFGGGVASGGIGSGLIIGIFFILLLGTTLFMALYGRGKRW